MAAKKATPVAERRLATFVHVGNSVYGPDDEIPAEVATLITNPAAWADTPGADESDPDSAPDVA